MSSPRPHRAIAEQLDLFHVPDHSPGMPAFHPRGMIVLNELAALWRELNAEHGYQEVRAPLVCEQRLWERSGHAAKFAGQMYRFDADGRPLGLKPMNCPGHADIFAARPRSYRELPMRLCELGHVHRLEPSGSLNGVLRARAFCQDDAHLFCRPNREADEIDHCLSLAARVYELLGLKARAELSLRPVRRLGDDRLWDHAEDVLRRALVRAGMDAEARPGGGAFYGPKIDLQVADGLGRSWQLGSVQLDYGLGGRLGLSYVAEDGRQEVPVVVHRAVYGSFERLLGILLEQRDGWLAPWLSPEAVRVLPVGAGQRAGSEALAARLRESGVRARVDAEGPLAGRLRAAVDWRVPVCAILGARENARGEVVLRSRRSERALVVDEAVRQLAEQVASRAVDPR
jgi:threonyl-tRNA synthetase